jgi:hypothetical protein
MPKGVYKRSPETRAKIATGTRKRYQERGVIGKGARAWKAYNRMPFDPDTIVIGHYSRRAHVPHVTCYLKEAKAILAGKDTRGRNKCVKLVGD